MNTIYIISFVLLLAYAVIQIWAIPHFYVCGDLRALTTIISGALSVCMLFFGAIVPVGTVEYTYYNATNERVGDVLSIQAVDTTKDITPLYSTNIAHEDKEVVIRETIQNSAYGFTLITVYDVILKDSID